MKKAITFLTILCGAIVFAQNFTLIGGTPFKGTTDGSAHLVDIDGDGDLDFFNTGDQGGSGFQGIAELFTNDGSGNFTLVAGTPFKGVESVGSEFADIEGDGDMDLILTGSISGGRVAELWLNDGTGAFTLDASQPFKDVSVGDVIIEDLDNDGDLDVILSGYNTAAAARITEVYKNNGANPAVFSLFTASPAFDLTDEGDVDVADVDGDGDLDLLTTGDTGPSELTSLYLNDGTGVFVKDVAASTLFTDMRDSDADFADVDGDGDQDLLINGRFGTSDRVAELYLNDGTGTFTLDASQPFIGGNAGTVDFFDADNDGDLDVLISGYENSTPNRNTRLYSNDGSGNFTEELSEGITGINNADIAIGDVDGNGTEDIIILGYSNTRIAEMYLNSGALLSVDRAEMLEGLKIYPNPTAEQLHVSSKEHEIVGMQLYNMLGKPVNNIKEVDSTLDLSTLPTGIYMLKIDFKTASVVQRIIKE
ncbi:T9SS type A sorting domain-containing protein [Aestuariivivens sediminis]|uniref:T9SS type A sorting domain-containing protein n=1 Tax=Aestuariivivens sediminis TaxID=2913557 RepID=UPI001F570BF7|nr:T9SS type A sorting domain-containing protein [Aestuariivivens sediminis]